MSDADSIKNAVLEKNQLRTRLCNGMMSVMESFNLGFSPTIDECTDLQIILGEYIEVILKKSGMPEPLAERKEDQLDAIDQTDVIINFTDIPGDETKSNDIIADLLSVPSFIDALYAIGLRKIARTEEVPVDDSIKRQLLRNGYVSALSIKVGRKKEDFLALTSRGWLCFERKNIAKQIRKERGYTSLMLPEWLSAPQTKWMPTTYLRALLLKRYFEKSASKEDYIVFSFPENVQLLFGCQSKASKDIEYVVAAPEKAAIKAEEMSTLKKIISSHIVNQVIILTSNNEYGQSLLKILQKENAGSEKAKLVNMEAAYV